MTRIAIYVVAAALAAGGLAGCGNAVRTAEAQADDGIPEYRFEVEIEGMSAGMFEGIDGLTTEIEIIEFQDNQDPLIRKRPGRTKYSNITLKKGYILQTPLRQWWEETVNGNLQRKNGTIKILDQAGQQVDQYNFFDAWPCKWKGFSLDGKGSDVNVEEIELAVERLERG